MRNGSTYALVPLVLGLLASNPGDPGGIHDVTVTGFRVEPADGGAVLTIELSGGASYSEFALDDPARLVVDIEAAGEALPRDRYTVQRGGITAIGSTELTPGVIRVTIDLEQPSEYSVSAGLDGIMVRLATGAADFEPWSTVNADAASGSASGEAASARASPAGPATAASAPPRSARSSLPLLEFAPGSPLGDPVSAAPGPQGSATLPRSRDDQEQQRITVTFQGVDIRDVLATFAEFSGRSIVPGAGVVGEVTATITNQPWDVALYAILDAYGLAAQELPSGILQVDAIENLQMRQTFEPLITRTFRINYVPVAELAQTLDPLRSERGRISTNPSTNTLLVTDVASVLDAMAAILGQLDVRTPQVSIQAKIVFVNRTDVEELGVTYDLKDSHGSSLNRVVAVPDPSDQASHTNSDVVSLGGASIAALGNANIRVQQPQLEAVLSLILGRHSLITFIDALRSQELSDVQAAPLITTLDNQPAEIWVGERTPLRVVDAGSAAVGGTGTSVPRATAELVETGIRLRVTPTITADRRILMQLHAERSSAQLAATDIGVVFQQQQGTTRLMVEDGQTAVIGGLTVTEMSTTRTGIPVLMDLPIIGRLFRTTRDRELQRDLLIMVTPRIVEDQG